MGRRRAGGAGVPKPGASPQTGLTLPAPPDRLLALLREHDRLLKSIGIKKKALATLGARIADVARRMAGARPVAEECSRLDKEIHALFDELLARKRQPRDTRRMVTMIYQVLQDTGVLSREREHADEHDPSDLPGGEQDPFGGTAHGEGAAPPFGAGGYSARRPGDEPANQSVRGLFRDLAMALHPDKVSDEVEKARRTEAMKEISRAYEEGDLARLLELKRIWMTSGAAAIGRDDVDDRCAKLARTNAALAGQLKDLNEEMRETRRSPLARLLRDLRRSTGRDGQDPVAAMLGQAKEELDRARELRDFVVAFRDGKISVDDLIRGPQSMSQREPDTDDDDFDEDGFDAFISSVFGEASASPPRARRKRRGSARRGGRQGDIPF